MAGKNFIIQGEKLQITLLSLLYLYVDIAATKRSPNINKLNWAIKWKKREILDVNITCSKTQKKYVNMPPVLEPEAISES